MTRILIALLSLALSLGAAAANNALVSVQWLQGKLGTEDVLVIDTSGPQLYAAGHIPGAVPANLYMTGFHRLPAAQLEARLQTWGISPEKKIVMYDQGATNMATWLFFELYHYGFPEANLHVLDGGLSKWKEAGGAVTKDPTPAPAKGTFRITKTREEVRTRMSEFMQASGDRRNHVLVEALEPESHFGDTKFFDKYGHIPHAVMWPNGDFYNADKTFKSPEEIRRMTAYLGIKPDQLVHSHCGGGVAATVPFFALKFISGHDKVKVYKESQLEWLKDDRDLPFWTYDAPNMKREAAWLNGWNQRMIRMFGVSEVSIVDVRTPEAYQQAHLPWALNVPAQVFRANFQEPAKLAAVLGPAGVDANHEAVIVSEGGLTPNAAIAFLALERAGQKKVSVMMESVDDWGLKGFTITKDATIVGAPKSPQDHAVPPATYPAAKEQARPASVYPRVLLVSGKKAPEKTPEGKVVHVPYTDLLNANGTPKPANEIWKILVKAGVPRYAEIICVSDDPGEAAVNYFVLKMMGYPDVKVAAA